MQPTDTRSESPWKDGFFAALQWVSTGGPNPGDAESVQTYQQRVVKAIHDTIRDDFGYDPALVYADSREHIKVMFRVFSWEVYQTLTGESQQRTMEAFGSMRNRATFSNLKKSIIGALDYNPSEKQDYKRFLYGVQLRLDAATKDDRMRYVDLGLPSGTRWADRNLVGFHGAALLRSPLLSMTFPAKADFEELIRECSVEWAQEPFGVRFVGKTGKSVFFPADGIFSVKVRGNGFQGQYILNESGDDDNVFKFYHSNVIGMSFGKTNLDAVSVSARAISR